uniref:protein-tyrosine-phosphatase n=1 Tax=Eptatretus burgeri TaxID=7764 RepID=A0A8C4R3B4_EPTBU
MYVPEKVTTIGALVLRHLLPSSLIDYYRYDGSMTTPPCIETVQWTVFRDRVSLSQSQLSKFCGIFTTERVGFSKVVDYLRDNYRPTHPSYSDSVFVSYGNRTGPGIFVCFHQSASILSACLLSFCNCLLLRPASGHPFPTLLCLCVCVRPGQQAGQRLLAGGRADWRIPLVVVASLTCACLIFLISVLIWGPQGFAPIPSSGELPCKGKLKCFQTAHFYVDDNDSPRVVPTSTLPFLPFSGVLSSRNMIVVRTDLRAILGLTATPIIVPLWNLAEKERQLRKKADQYWPLEASEECGGILVTLKSTRITFNYTVRQFILQNARLKKGSQKVRPVERMVTQFHCTKWPKSVSCESALALLAFIRRSGASRTEAMGPTLVHCSAAVGRTGTYIVLDSMLHQMREQGTVNVLGFLKHVRTQRKYLVQTEEQYIFIHDVLVHAVVCGDTEASAENLHAYVDSLLIPDSTGFTALERQFKVCFDIPVTAGMTFLLMISEQWRVCLTTRSGVEGSDYINASFIPGYRQDHEYIVTQRPAPHTMGGFWRMVWERKAQLIVSMAEDMPLTEEEYVYWPIRDKALNCGNFCVKLLKEDCLQLASAERLASERPLELKLIKCPRWPNPDGPISGAFELITIMNDEKMTSERPIIVHDQLGGVSAAAFCGLASLWDQLEEENIMDVFQVARGIQKARPGSFTDLEHYQFLYKALLSLVVSRETRNGLSLAERNGVAILPEDGSVAESLQSLV